MNRKYLLLGLSLIITMSLFSSKSFAQDPNFHIYVCFGQSNMEGQGTVQAQDKKVDERFKVFQSLDCSSISRTKGEWYTAKPPLANCWSGLSPADYFGKTMVANLPDSVTIGVINVSVGGCDIRLFDKDIYQDHVATYDESWFTDKVEAYSGNPYLHLMELALQAQQDGVIKGILLHQGETNYGDTQWPEYVSKIYNNMLTDLSLEAESTPLIAGEVVSAEGNCCAGMNEIINKLPETIDNSYVISSEGLTAMDDAHFDSEGYRRFGRRYAAQMLSIMGLESVNIEAECSTAGESWIIGEDEEASNGGYLTIPEDIEISIDASSQIKFDFSVVSNTTYYAYGRFNNESTDTDAIEVKVNEGDNILYDELTTDGWEWKPLGDYELTTGAHSMTLSYAEAGVKIDKVVFKNTNRTPVGVAEDAINVCTLESSTVGISIQNTTGYFLAQNYPNPVNGQTKIAFEIPTDSYVSLKLYSIMGFEVLELINNEYPSGKHIIEFDTNELEEGTYFYTLNAGKFSATRKMVLLPK